MPMRYPRAPLRLRYETARYVVTSLRCGKQDSAVVHLEPRLHDTFEAYRYLRQSLDAHMAAAWRKELLLDEVAKNRALTTPNITTGTGANSVDACLAQARRDWQGLHSHVLAFCRLLNNLHANIMRCTTLLREREFHRARVDTLRKRELAMTVPTTTATTTPATTAMTTTSTISTTSTSMTTTAAAASVCGCGGGGRRGTTKPFLTGCAHALQKRRTQRLLDRACKRVDDGIARLPQLVEEAFRMRDAVAHRVAMTGQAVWRTQLSGMWAKLGVVYRTRSSNMQQPVANHRPPPAVSPAVEPPSARGQSCVA